MNLKNFFASILCIFILTPVFSFALTPAELQKLIDQKRAEQQRIEEENKRLTEEIGRTQMQAATLQTAVKSLDQNAKKLGNDLNSTKTNISATQYEIEKLGLNIRDAGQKIVHGREALAESLRNIAASDRESLMTSILAEKTLADAWNEVEEMKQLNETLRGHITILSEAKEEFTKEQEESRQKKGELQNLQSTLNTQQKIVLENQAAKTKLLVETKSQESEYQKQLKANIELGKQFEKEIFEYEAQLERTIDPSKLPSQRPGILQWPLASVFLTQRFGATVSAKRLYVSGTHNGIDFRAAVGTPVKAVLAGVVVAVGNTDDQRGCYSYGRWALIRHNNGLSSLYAHLSGLKVGQGATVATGETIGFTGGQPGASGSGFSTGPHLHLGIFASDGVKVERYLSSRFCQNISIPIAPPAAYLDPLVYLPSI